MSFLERPQNVWLRKAAFQIHLWTGLILGLYFIVIGVSGSVLVFRHEIGDWMAKDEERAVPVSAGTGSPLSPGEILGRLRGKYGKDAVFNLGAPRQENPAYTALVSPRGKFMTVSVDPFDGKVLREHVFKDTWLNFTARLHINLNFGRTGFIANGIGGICLLLLSITGIVIWWPGIRSWRRALVVDFRKSWKRINFDLHSAAGFWTIGWILVWSVTTIYFVWPKESKAVIEVFSPLTKPAQIEVPPRGGKTELELDALLSRAQALYPSGKFTRVQLPRSTKQAMVVEMSRTHAGDYSNMDFVHIDPTTGKHLGTSHGGQEPQTAGDWVVWLMAPIHFGDRWGLVVKIIWATVGISLPLLTVTGFFMYWNRYLGKKWRRRKPATHADLPLKVSA